MKKLSFLTTLIGLFCSLFFVTNNLTAQVEYSIKLQPDLVTYVVYLRPTITWTAPLNQTGTGQVTIVAPNGFAVNNLTSTNGNWSLTTTTIGPSQNPTKTYFDIGLAGLGTTDITYTSGVEEELFRFTYNGNCLGAVELIDNPTDPFSGNGIVNVGNQITTFGSSNQNAWIGNYDTGSASCSSCGANAGIFSY